MRQTAIATTILVILALVGPSAADIPRVINYQGKVTDNAGNPVADGTYTMRFHIYNVETGGTALWSSGDVTTTIDAGIFSVLLGESPQPEIGLDFDEDCWLEVDVEGDIQAPRSRLGATGYAYMASGLVAGTVVSGSVSTGSMAALEGGNTATTGYTYGLFGSSASALGAGVCGYNPTGVGVYGATSSGYAGWFSGQARFDVGSGRIEITTPYSHPGIMGIANNGNRRDIRFEEGGLRLLTSNDSGIPGSTNGIVIDESGNVSIGNASPQAKFDVRPNMVVSSTDGDRLFRVRQNADGSAMVIVYDDADNATIKLNGGAVEGPSYLNQGNVGIGTTNPGSKLDVKAPSAGDVLTVTSSDNDPLFRARQTSGGQGEIRVFDAVGDVKVKINGDDDSYFNAGDVGIGTTSPAYPLHVNNLTDFAIYAVTVAPTDTTTAAIYGYAPATGVKVFGGRFESNSTAILALGEVWAMESWGNPWAKYAGWGYKCYSNGACGFVQNHPDHADRVIVYTAPEGDEVATYTRGTARLQNGEAIVPLGETFKWVTNPDIGLTAHLTPRGNCLGLYVESLNTREMTVRELQSGDSDVTFDYVVYGLRIGFEEASIVQKKPEEAYIPALDYHKRMYREDPGLRAYNALERFKTMRSGLGENRSLDMSASLALRDAITVYDPAIHKRPGAQNGPNTRSLTHPAMPKEVSAN